MSSVTINFNGSNYIATYNVQTGYYETNIEAPNETGGIYTANIIFNDFLNNTFTDTKSIQVLVKEKLKIETNKVFMWIFDYKDFSVKDIVEISDYEINIDEETNSTSIIKVLKKTNAKARDIIMIKKNNNIVFWGIIENIQNDSGKKLYEYNLKYITNIFNRNIQLLQNIKTNNSNFFEGAFSIKCAVSENLCADVNGASTSNNANIVISEFHGGYNQKFYFKEKRSGIYTIQALHSLKYMTVNSSNNIIQYEETGESDQEWRIEKISTNVYSIISVKNGLYMDVEGGTMSSGTNLRLFTSNSSNAQKFYLVKNDEDIIKTIGIEDYIAITIKENFISNVDTFINKNYLGIDVNTHTIKQTSVSNIENGIYNLHTWLTNCTQNYDIVYSFSIVNKKLIITIENKSYDKELIDTKAQAISNYTEVFETNIVSKVNVLTSTNTYTLYLLNDRTTTTDMTNVNRAEGRIETVYTEKYEDAQQTALDVMKANSYNHNITFNLYNKLIKVGTPITIKTKESLILNTYISAIKLTPKKFIEYTCGNIRINFIDKLLKERKK